MLSCGMIVRLTCTRSIRCYECREKKGVWLFMAYSLSSKRRTGMSKWVMRAFKFRPYLSLSLSLSLFLRVGVDVVCLLLIWPAVVYIVFLFRWDQIVFCFFCFLPRRSRIGRKMTFNYVYFLTNFIDISLCADPVRRNPFFHFEESVSTDDILGASCNHYFVCMINFKRSLSVI